MVDNPRRIDTTALEDAFMVIFKWIQAGSPGAHYNDDKEPFRWTRRGAIGTVWECSNMALSPAGPFMWLKGPYIVVYARPEERGLGYMGRIDLRAATTQEALFEAAAQIQALDKPTPITKPFNVGSSSRVLFPYDKEPEPAPTVAAVMLPWHRPELSKWTIVGMCHHHIEGKRILYVSMKKGCYCITAEGKDTPEIWDILAAKAENVKGTGI